MFARMALWKAVSRTIGPNQCSTWRASARNASKSASVAAATQQPGWIVEKRTLVKHELDALTSDRHAAQPVVPVLVDGEGQPVPLDGLLDRSGAGIAYEVGQLLHLASLIWRPLAQPVVDGRLSGLAHCSAPPLLGPVDRGPQKADAGGVDKPGLLKKVDAVTVRVPDLDAGLAFYVGELRHRMKWRNDAIGQAGIELPNGDSELVLTTEHAYQPNWLVDSVDHAVETFRNHGGNVVAEPFDLPVGRAAVVRDPFGNALVLVDLSKGTYVTDHQGTVTGTTPVVSD